MDYALDRSGDGLDEAATTWGAPGKRTRTEQQTARRAPVEEAGARHGGPRPAAADDELTELGVTAREWEVARHGGDARGAHGRTPPREPATATAAQVDDAVRREILAGRGDLSVAVFPRYQDGVRDAAQFERSATSFATNHRTLAVVGDRLVLGAPIAIARLTDAQTGIAAVGAALRAIDPALRVHNVALFAHGEPTGMGLAADNDFDLSSRRDLPHPPAARPGAARTPAAAPPTLDAEHQRLHPSVVAFRDAIRNTVATDVRFLLFGCATGRDPIAQDDLRDWQGHREGERWGTDSFAQELADAFGPDASSYAHATYGHATENSASLVFGHDAGGGRGGLHLFEQMYPRAFVESEVRELLGDQASDAELFAHNYRYLRDRMHSHWMSRVNPDHQDRRTHQMTHSHLNLPAQGADRRPRPIGQEMFAQPAVAAAALQADWRAHRTDFVSPWRPQPVPAARAR